MTITKIKIKMSNPSQEPPPSSKAKNQNLKDMDVLCTLKIKTEPKFVKLVYQRPVTISKSSSRCKTPVGNFHVPPKPSLQDSKARVFFAPAKLR